MESILNRLDSISLPESLRRLSADAIEDTTLQLVHTGAHIQRIRDVDKEGGGRLDSDTVMSADSFQVARKAVGCGVDAVRRVVAGEDKTALCLVRPPGHHATPESAMGFCLYSNIAIAARYATRTLGLDRVLVVDWDVHHGNGTEAIFYERDDVLTVSIHQDRNYPMDQGAAEDRGSGAGQGFNLNVPLPPGCGHNAYVEAMERLALPAVRAFDPDVLIIACGFDAAGMDPLGRMMCHTATYQTMTRQVMELAVDVCDGRLAMAHEGGYSEVYVPFCGHTVLAEMVGSAIVAPDPFGDTWVLRQPNADFDAFVSDQITRMATAAGL